MTRASTPACTSDLACFRNDGHTGDHAYATPDTGPQPVADRPEGTIRRKVWFSETLALGLGASLLTWGEPDDDGFYTPTLTRAIPAPLDDPVIAAMRPARRGGYRRLTFDNGRYETYDCVFIQHPGGEWDRILIARDDGTIATALAALINATPAPLDVSRLARVMREMCDCIRSDSDAEAWARDIAAAYQADEP